MLFQLATTTSRDKGATGDAVVLVNLAFVFALFGLPWLWNESPVAYSFVWTASSALLIFAAAARCEGWHAFRGPGALAGLFFITYPILCSFSYLATSGVDAEKEVQLFQDLKELVFVSLFFVLGHCSARYLDRKAVVLTYCACLAYILFRREVFTDPEKFYLFGIERGNSLNYQHLGDAFVASSILLVNGLRSIVGRLLILVASSTALLILPSRSSLLLGAVCMFLATFPDRWRLVLGVGALLSLGGALLLEQQEMLGLFEGTRLQALVLPQEDMSYSLRQAALREGMNVIATYPLSGSYQFQLDSFGIAGLYIHNFLNTWAQAGFLSFLILCTFIGKSVWRVMGPHRQISWKIPGALLLFALLSWLFTRTTMSAPIFLCIGLALGSDYQRRSPGPDLFLP